jgi:pyruvate/2-oxoglutarate dehydrogenase complex dihydrolipoamide acyltransferase (E2) component
MEATGCKSECLALALAMAVSFYARRNLYGGTTMRTALASLIAVAGLASAAGAQETPAAAPPPSPPAAAASAPAAAPPPPAAESAPPAPAPAEPPPTLPTSGDGAQVLQAIEKVCVPAVRGQGLDAAAKAVGLKLNRRDATWTMPLASGRDYAIVFQPQYSQTNVCRAEVHYAIGQDKPIVSALNIWSFLHQPQLVLQANYVNVDADGVKRIRKSWEHVEPNGASTAVNFSIWRKPDDSPINSRYETGMLFYQERAGQ